MLSVYSFSIDKNLKINTVIEPLMKAKAKIPLYLYRLYYHNLLIGILNELFSKY